MTLTDLWRFCGAAGLAGALLSTPAVAQTSSPYAAKLAQCRAAAEAADLDPTKFACDWKAVVAGAPGAALTGRFASRIKGVGGTLTILEAGGQPALIGISTVNRRSTHTCTVKVTAERGPDDALVAKPADAEGCVIRIRSSGRNRVRVEATSCGFFCGVSGTFAGDFALQGK